MNETILRIITSVIAGSLFFGFFYISTFLFLLSLVVVYAYILLVEWPRLCDTATLKGAFFSFIYPIIPMTSLFIICAQQSAYSTVGALYPFIVAWMCDIGAYTFGKLYGKTKVCPSISPGKSYEGLLGSVGVSLLVHMNFWFWGAHVSAVTSWWQWMLLGIVMPLIAFAGDVFVSYLKRGVSVKDTGGVLPGHGGLLDRFDSVFFVAPAWLLMLW